MDGWIVSLLVMFGSIIALIILGFPVVIAFMMANLLGAVIFLGGELGIIQMIRNLRPSIAQYSLVPIPLFVLMGEIMLQSGMARRAIEALDTLIIRMPGRLSIVSILGGTSFASLSGSSVANAAIVGRTLLPQMSSRQYSDIISIGPVVAVGGIAALIPPSAMAVMLGSLAKISINELLLAGLIPGLMMIVLFLGYVMIRCKMNPALAPAGEEETRSWGERIGPFVRNVLPLFMIFAAVVGSMVAGIATPTESAAIGVLAAIIAGFCYRCMGWSVISTSLLQTLKFSAMILLIICCSGTFSQILSFTGATEELTRLVIEGSGLSANQLVLLMLLVLLALGCLMESASIMMLTVPIFFPILNVLDVNTLWFALMMMVALEIGLCTPPFGMLLFVVQGVLGSQVKIERIYRAVLPFLMLQLLVLAVIFMFPGLISWLPNVFQ